MKKTVLTLFLCLIAGVAYADGSTSLNQFSPPPGDTSVDYLREVFGNIVGMVASGGNTETFQGDDVLGSMMRVFNGAVLFLGMLFVGYTTIKGTLDSAHDGVVLGKKMSNIWVPLRTVGGTAVLLPLSSGYSLIQIVVLWLAIQGIGVGDAVWKQAINQIKKDNMFSRPIIPDSRPLAANILRFEVCAAAMNKDFAASGRSSRIVVKETSHTLRNAGEPFNYGDFAVSPVVGGIAAVNNYANSYYVATDYKWAQNDDPYGGSACGGLSWKESWESSEGNSNAKVIKGPIIAAHARAVQAMIAELQPVAQQIVDGKKPDIGALDTAANNYENTLRDAANTAVQQTNDRARADFLQAADAGGWLFAGTWYNHIVKMNDVMQSTLNALPTSDPIEIQSKNVPTMIQTYSDAMAVVKEYAKQRTDSVRNVYYSETDWHKPQEGEGAWEYVRKLISAPFMGAINQMTQEIAGSNLNHMSQMKSFGDSIVGIGESVLISFAIASGVTNSVDGQVGSAILSLGSTNAGAIVSFLSTFVTILVYGLMAFGVTLSTYVPMIPFITWMTSLANWFVLVIESIIAAPIFAVAHVHPDGDDAVGKAGQGYMMILSLVMRPTLMLFGLITGMLLTQPLTGIINTAFMTVVSGVQADSLTGIVSFMAYVAIYVIMMTTVVHLVFSLIHWVPDNVLRWIGGHVSGLAEAGQVADKGQHAMVGGVFQGRQAFQEGMAPKNKDKLKEPQDELTSKAETTNEDHIPQ